jgi:hypothetical protein
MYSWKISIFLIKNCDLLIPRPPEHPVLKNMKILDFFLFLWVIFALLDPDPETQINADPCGSGSETLPAGLAHYPEGCFQGKTCETINALALGYSDYDVFLKKMIGINGCKK